MDKEHLKSVDDMKLRHRLVARLRSGEVLMMPSDTIYGLSCRADSSEAVNRIFTIKKRGKGYPLIILVSSLSMAQKYCHINTQQKIVLKKIWSSERPTSVLLRHRGLLVKEVTANSLYLAVRLPKSDFLRKMIRALAVPIVSTSANFSGQPVISGEEAEQYFYKGVGPDLVLIGKPNKLKASKLVRIDEKGFVEVLRK
ncbi:L-threonylcarbamoyladenylate synthase [Patescibacteria group bacterium]|nr:L-threonylcarbamoyladenylate synthase [Patescibacteria group bacterium]